MQVYKSIAAVMADLAKDGISKDRRNQQQGYNFRGIDDVYNALAPALAKHGLCVLPRILSREITERQSSKGGVLFYVVVEAEFDFIAAEDGSKHTVRTYGEAMDSADKATNKAMSAAYKYAAMQAFCIPTEGDNDADATTHEVAPRKGRPEPVRTDAQQDSEVEQIVRLIGTVQTAEALGDLWKSARVQAAVRDNDPLIARRIVEAKDLRKAELNARVLEAG